MQRKPPYCLKTQDTEDCSSEENQRNYFINDLQQASIIDVWADNFHQQMQKISVLTKRYNIIAIDTEFPSIQEYNEKFDYSDQFYHEKYLKLTKNVDNTSVIQLGMCLADQEGNVLVDKFCWQFNFKFQGDIEEISSSSAFLLKKAGINFDKLRSHGISYKTFTHEFIKSGLLLNKNNKWVVFHGGYDFSYLLKLIRNQSLPKSTQEFYKSIKIYFPQKIDIKHIIQKDKRLKKYGLSKLADSILCRRIGPQHQAGSDSLLTLQCYFKLKQQFNHVFESNFNLENIIYGIGIRETSKYPKNMQQSNGLTYISESQFYQSNLMYYNFIMSQQLFTTNPFTYQKVQTENYYNPNPRYEQKIKYDHKDQI